MQSITLARGGGIAALVGVFFLAFVIGPGCTQLGLNTASRSLPDIGAGLPPVLPETADLSGTSANWTSHRERLKDALAASVYGPYPKGLVGQVVERRVIDEAFAEGAGRLEELTVALGSGETAPRFHIGLALPASALETAPAPLIVGQHFCDVAAVMQDDRLSPPEPLAGGSMCGSSIAGPLVKLIFGAHIESPPIKSILQRGYAYAAIYPSEVAPDSKKRAPEVLAQLGALADAGSAPEGVIAVWAATYGWAMDVLDADPRLDANKSVVWGHSRHGKAALLAAAYDERIDGVISHQSGTGGATLSRSLNGESVGAMTRTYPHWFSPEYAKYADREADLPVDQHMLVALAAPRPVLLGNGWKDVWSDPNGAFRAAQAADVAWDMLGRKGLTQTGLDDPDYLNGELAFQIRAGAHGVRKTDWRSFLDWMDHWFAPG